MKSWTPQREWKQVFGKSEHFLPHMWHLSRFTQITGNQSYVTVSEQTIQHNNVKQSCQICAETPFFQAAHHTLSQRTLETAFYTWRKDVLPHKWTETWAWALFVTVTGRHSALSTQCQDMDSRTWIWLLSFWKEFCTYVLMEIRGKMGGNWNTGVQIVESGNCLKFK